MRILFQIASKMLRYLLPVLLSVVAYIYLPKCVWTTTVPKYSTRFLQKKLTKGEHVMSFRSGSHLLVVLQLSTPMLLPKQLEALGDVK